MQTFIRKYRDKAGLTQEQLAAEIGVARTQITKWELDNQDITLRWLRKISKALKVSIAQIITDTASISAETTDNDQIIYWVIELCAKSARDHPELPEGMIAGIGQAVYRAALAGKLPDLKSATGKKPPKSLRDKTQELVDYEIGRLN